MRIGSRGPRAAPGLALLFCLCNGCGQAAPSETAAETSRPLGDEDAEAAEQVAPQPSLKDLGPTGRRALVIVLPGDASIEVDGAAVRRRDGAVELTGRVGEKHRLRVLKGALSKELEVALLDTGASPALIDLHAPVPGGKGGTVGPEETGTEGPAAKPPANALFSDKFDD